MSRSIFKALALSTVLLLLPAAVQGRAIAQMPSSCGNPAATFKVTLTQGENPTRPEAGKALVFLSKKI